MVRFSPKHLTYAVAVLVLLGAVLVAASSERIRCAFGQSCNEIMTASPPEGAVPVATTTPTIATTTQVVATTTVKAKPPAPKRAAAPKTAPAPVIPPKAFVPVPPVVPPLPPPPSPPPIPPPAVPVEEGPTTFSVSPVPLLAGGEVRGGESVPLSYLQIVNKGKYAARLKGFWVRQNGNAPTRTVIGLSTVDDKGGSRGQVGGTEGSSPFIDGSAFAPTDALFLPGQLRLFTIKATMASDISDHAGTELKIDVTSLKAKDVTFTGSFPIRGTTWTLSSD